MKPFAVALVLIVLAFVFLGALALMVIPPAVAIPNPHYPMNAQAVEPPPQPDLGAGEGFMYDATRWAAFVVEGEIFLFTPEAGFSRIPVGTILLVPARPDSL